MMTPTTTAATVLDVELSERVPELPTADAGGGAQAWLLVRLFTEPIGMTVIRLGSEPIPAAAVLDRIQAEHADVLARRLAAAGTSSAALTPVGLGMTGSPFTAQRDEILADAPDWTVVICTRDRPAGLRRTLESLTAQDYPAFRVLVVDNAPTTGETRRAAEEYRDRLSLDYLVEPRPGLSRARNRALAEVRTSLVAWLDDDAAADRFWLAELTRGFAVHPEAAAVAGLVVPLALETPEQLLFEEFGGHSKGRGFTADVFSPATASQQSPLYPLPPFGVGANMAFRTVTLRAIGGFDEALGAGTRTFGGEDTKAFTQVLLRGETMVYQPTALVRHLHRADLAGLRRQLVGYGAGLTAFYTALVLDRPSLLRDLVGLVRKAARDLFSSDSARTATVTADFPVEILRANRRAMLTGPVRYVLARYWDGRRTRGTASRAQVPPPTRTGAFSPRERPGPSSTTTLVP